MATGRRQTSTPLMPLMPLAAAHQASRRASHHASTHASHLIPLNLPPLSTSPKARGQTAFSATARSQLPAPFLAARAWPAGLFDRRVHCLQSCVVVGQQSKFSRKIGDTAEALVATRRRSSAVREAQQKESETHATASARVGDTAVANLPLAAAGPCWRIEAGDRGTRPSLPPCARSQTTSTSPAVSRSTVTATPSRLLLPTTPHLSLLLTPHPYLSLPLPTTNPPTSTHFAPTPHPLRTHFAPSANKACHLYRF